MPIIGTIEPVTFSTPRNATVPNKKKPPTETFRVNAEMARKIRIISAARKQSVPDYLVELFGPTVEKEYAKFAKGLAKEMANPKGESE